MLEAGKLAKASRVADFVASGMHIVFYDTLLVVGVGTIATVEAVIALLLVNIALFVVHGFGIAPQQRLSFGQRLRVSAVALSPILVLSTAMPHLPYGLQISR